MAAVPEEISVMEWINIDLPLHQNLPLRVVRVKSSESSSSKYGSLAVCVLVIYKVNKLSIILREINYNSYGSQLMLACSMRRGLINAFIKFFHKFLEFGVGSLVIGRGTSN